MPVARNMQQLEAMLQKELSAAMNEVATEAMVDMQKATKYFYDGGSPIWYSRTGALGNTPKVTPIRKYGNLISFKAYLDLGHTYNTGDQPNMLQVLNLANYGQPWITSGGNPARPTVGSMGFWERAEEDMKKSLNNTLRRHFR